ncbi:MAG: hypothetical protein J6S97_07610 [Bacteroidales bacterium]|nr:hypothetical protein [Bacteroidales bacterium]
MKEKKIIYQVLTRIWDSGRLSCWDAAALDYLHSLGVDYIWFTGIPRHATGEAFVKGNPGSPYAVSDWYDINPYLADDPARRMEEFRALVERVHGSGLGVIIDFIPNHVACNYKGNLRLYPWCDSDWTDTLKVDWSDPATEKEFLEVLRFWAGMGVDGFRCDMVELVPADSLRRLIADIHLEHPGLLFIAEVYGRENYRRYINEVGFNLLYDKSGVYDILRGVMDGSRSARDLSWNWQFLGDIQDNMLNFLENHDEQRLASPAFAQSAACAWGAVAYAMLFNSASWMFYAGQEVGEDASESADRRTSIFNWSHPAGLEHLGKFIHGGTPLPDKEGDILARYRRLGTLARTPLFRSGEVWDLCYCNQQTPGLDLDHCTAFMRYNGTEAMLVLCNFGPQVVSTDLFIPRELREVAAIDKSEATLHAPAYGYALLKCK